MKSYKIVKNHPPFKKGEIYQGHESPCENSKILLYHPYYGSKIISRIYVDEVNMNSNTTILNNTPPHYNKPFQPIDVSEGNGYNMHQANILKYIDRYKEKDGVKDLYKAKDYLERLIKLEENESNK